MYLLFRNIVDVYVFDCLILFGMVLLIFCFVYDVWILNKVLYGGIYFVI